MRVTGKSPRKLRLIEYTGETMMESGEARRYRFGVFEADAAAGELRRQGVRVKVNVQPFQVLLLLLARPGEVLTRDEIARELWPEGTFVDYEHGVNSAVNRIREALGDSARNPRFVETLARRGYRFVAPVVRIGEQVLEAAAGAAEPVSGSISGQASFLATEAELPQTSHQTVQVLFVLLQVMYVGYYVGALANLAEIEELVSGLSTPLLAMSVLVVSAALLIPVRLFLVSAALMHAPGFRGKYLKMWPFLLPADVLWSLAPFLLLHHMSAGLALACMAPLVYAPFAQRSLVLMGAGRKS